MFVNLSRNRKWGAERYPERNRLTRQGVFRLVREWGRAAGLKVKPHGLRHASITEALDRGINIRSVQRFSRHLDLRTVMIYDDNRQDLAGEVARALAEE